MRQRCLLRMTAWDQKPRGRIAQGVSCQSEKPASCLHAQRQGPLVARAFGLTCRCRRERACMRHSMLQWPAAADSREGQGPVSAAKVWLFFVLPMLLADGRSAHGGRASLQPPAAVLPQLFRLLHCRITAAALRLTAWVGGADHGTPGGTCRTPGPKTLAQNPKALKEAQKNPGPKPVPRWARRRCTSSSAADDAEWGRSRAAPMTAALPAAASMPPAPMPNRPLAPSAEL